MDKGWKYDDERMKKRRWEIDVSRQSSVPLPRDLALVTCLASPPCRPSTFCRPWILAVSCWQLIPQVPSDSGHNDADSAWMDALTD